MQKISVLMAILLAIFGVDLFPNSPASEAQPIIIEAFEIATSIKPIHSLVCALTLGITQPKLLLNANFSPHQFQITPSQAMAIQRAKVIIWIGPVYEKPLEQYLQKIDAKALTLQNDPRIRFKPLRHGAFWDNTGRCDHGQTTKQINLDGHIWLDPTIMLQVVDVVVEHLIAQYPGHKPKLEANATAYRERLKKLSQELRQQMAPYKGKTYIMQHDGNQYFDAAFGTETIATISIDPAIPPGAGHMLKLRQAVLRGKIHPQCLFSEQQMDGALAKNYADTLQISFGSLDYLGADIQPGEAAYEQIMQAYVNSFIQGIAGK